MSNQEKAGRGIPVAPSVTRNARANLNKRQWLVLAVFLAGFAAGFAACLVLARSA